MTKFLLIQTAFIGDVILATALIEKISRHFPDATIHFLLRKGNEVLIEGHPSIENVLIWNKKNRKIQHLIQLLFRIRKSRYDYVINMQRFASTGILTAFSRGKQKIGFHNNPFSYLFTKRIKHQFQKGIHEVDRNLSLIQHITNGSKEVPKLYPLKDAYEKVASFKNTPYLCLAPTSVWYTKQFPASKWIEFINNIPEKYTIYLLGSPSDFNACENILSKTKHQKVRNLAGKINLMESAALMELADMNFVNDSAPLHLASAMNAPVTAIFCSTVPEFGFGPLSDQSFVIQTNIDLDCRPCGIHGFNECPINTFECAHSISLNTLLSKIPD